MGLTIVSEIVEQAGGSIVVTSRERETCFEVRLPVEVNSEEKKDVS